MSTTENEVDRAGDFYGLMARLRAGDESALSPLVENYADIVRRTAHRLLGRALRPYLDSVDLVQSVHRALLAGLRDHKFEIATPDQLVSLALTILRRRVARHWRHLRHEPGAETDTPDFTLAGLREPDATADPTRDPLFNDEVDRLLAGMAEVDRRLLELRLQGHSTAAAARVLGVDAGFLRVRLSRLRQRLQAEGWFHGRV
jgi:RNA polymerase sigma-70 factor (ECF subfamily)